MPYWKNGGNTDFAPDALPMRNEHLTSEDILRFRDNAFREYFESERYQNMVRRRLVLKYWIFSETRCSVKR